MAHTLKLTADVLTQLDITAAQQLIDSLIEKGTLLDSDVRLAFDIDFPRDPTDPRELSEIPEIRLWFIRLDATYPWLPFVLDWEAGELGRYAAMLVPHQFSPKDGIRYNPEALEIFVMNKIFVVANWLQQQGVQQMTRLKFMTQMLGYEIDDGLFDLLLS
ncbi:CRR6 family NdhI maturation factor [Oscillatoria sp. CS-180]|uniref:CRR6 family NdhI maturation factor n=1 Tax=Oscillatoria sp. CS-180 TaxID=3021720 RepID=UPI00232D90FC|nr:CRR6 family NdhI maturation factor [Oscillatoria sp. CS-180]MDB9528930.1 CRR6 family NdhI maturation factor [Oscillatoria sp. CS-180]